MAVFAPSRESSFEIVSMQRFAPVQPSAKDVCQTVAKSNKASKVEKRSLPGLTLQKHLQQNFFKKNCWLKVAKLVRGLQKLSNKGGKITFDNLFVLTHGAENLCRCAVCPH